MPRSRLAPRLVLIALLVGTTLAWWAGNSGDSMAQGAACSWSWERLPSGEERSQHSMVYLPVDQAVLTFAGADMRTGDGSSLHDDLHRLELIPNPGSWQRLRPSGGPSDVMQHSAVLRWRGPDQDMIVYGGVDEIPGGGGGGTITWESPLTGGGWAHRGLTGAYAPERVSSDAHRLSVAGDQAQWRRIIASGQTRADHSAIFDPNEDAMIVYGGRRSEEASSVQDSTYRLSLGDTTEWTPLPAGTNPGKRFAHSAVYDPVSSRMLVFGGTTDWEGTMNDVWALRLLDGFSNATWERITADGSPPRGRYDHTAVFAPELEQMIVFGGQVTVQNQVNDVWALDLAQQPPVWIRISPAGNGPPAMAGATAVWVPETKTMVIHGGQVGGDSRDQTWALVCETSAVSPTPTETEESATPTPSETPGDVETVTPTNTVDDTVTPTETGEVTVTPTDETVTPTDDMDTPETPSTPETPLTPTNGPAPVYIYLPHAIYLTG